LILKLRQTGENSRQKKQLLLVQFHLKTGFMKLNWGYKILIVYLMFAAGMLTMVYLTTQENRDLVSDNYYEEELAYQEIIDQSSRTAKLSAAVEVELNQMNKKINISLPSEFKNTPVEGTWRLYYAADRKRDLQGIINTNNGKQQIETQRDITGSYTLKLQWESVNQVYYFEKLIFF
jgi:hypothetical protein